MQIYILFDDIVFDDDDECPQILGVFSTEEKAKAAKARYLGKYRYREADIMEYEIDLLLHSSLSERF